MRIVKSPDPTSTCRPVLLKTQQLADLWQIHKKIHRRVTEAQRKRERKMRSDLAVGLKSSKQMYEEVC
jgi:hypothetical protein